MNLENLVVGLAWPEPSLGDPAATHGKIAALAEAQASAKLRSVNRELNQCAQIRKQTEQ